MRIWDVHPGYLARQQLLGEHRELHGLFNILHLGKKGYSQHPETLRWVGHLPALIYRHEQLVAEMQLRGYKHHSPLAAVPDHADAEAVDWPNIYIDDPDRQFALLQGKYAADMRSGRIPLPRNCQQLWAQHKYAVMAIDPDLYRRLGPEVAHGIYVDDMAGLSRLLVETIRQQPGSGRVHNALLHMWGYVKSHAAPMPDEGRQLAAAIQAEAVRQKVEYLQHSTALCDIVLWA